MCIPGLLTQATRWLHHRNSHQYMELPSLSVASPEDVSQGVTVSHESVRHCGIS